MRLTTISNVIDWIVIIIMSTYGLALTGTYTIDVVSKGSPYNLFLFVCFFHLVRFGLKFDFLFVLKKKNILILFFFIYIIDVFQACLYHTFDKTCRIIFLTLTVFVFMSYLFNVHNFHRKRGRNGLEDVLHPYKAYVIYNLVVILLMFILITMGVPYQLNPLGDDVMLISGHSEWKLDHYFPYYLCMTMFFHDIFPIPTLTGLSHEAHVIMFVITPGVFFLLGMRSKWKYAIFGMYLFTLIETTSTTAIVCALVVFSMEILRSAIIKRKCRLLLGAVVIGGVCVWLLSELLSIVHMQVLYKLEGQDDSGATSQSMLEYLFSFRDIWCLGNFPKEYGLELRGQSGGIITGLLDLLLYVKLWIVAFKCLLNQNKEVNFIGLGCMYFFLHMSKLSYMSFSYLYFTFILFVVVVLENYHLESQSVEWER